MCSYIPGRNMRTRVHRRFSSRACRANRVYCDTLVSMSSLQIPALYRRQRGSSQNHNGSAGRSLSAYSEASVAQKVHIEDRSSQCLWQVFRLDVDHKTPSRVSICCVQSSRTTLSASFVATIHIKHDSFLGGVAVRRGQARLKCQRSGSESTRKFKRFWHRVDD